jgi:C4-type Zn-finger protein
MERRTDEEAFHEAADPLACPVCGAQMKIIALITNYAAIDRIIHHLGITFTSQRPPPPARQEGLY